MDGRGESNGGVSGSGIPAEPAAGLPAFAGGGTAVGSDAAPSAAAAVCRGRRHLRGGDIPAGLWIPPPSGVPARSRKHHGAVRLWRKAASGVAFSAVGRRVGGIRAGAGTVGRIAHRAAAPALSGRGKLDAAHRLGTGILFFAAPAAGAGRTSWGRRAIEDHHIRLRTEADRHGAARHRKHPAGSGIGPSGTGAGARRGGGAVAAVGGGGIGLRVAAGGEDGAAPPAGGGHPLFTAAVSQRRYAGGTAAGRPQRLHRDQRPPLSPDAGGPVGLPRQRRRRLPRPVGRSGGGGGEGTC